MRAKYGNRKCTFAGQAFDSRLERDDYVALLAREQAGEITCLMRQDRYCLQDGFVDADGKRHRAIYVVWDFAYEEEGQAVCWDSKGYPTPEFRLKEKMFRLQYPDIKLVIHYTGGKR